MEAGDPIGLYAGTNRLRGMGGLEAVFRERGGAIRLGITWDHKNPPGLSRELLALLGHGTHTKKCVSPARWDDRRVGWPRINWGDTSELLGGSPEKAAAGASEKCDPIWALLGFLAGLPVVWPINQTSGYYERYGRGPITMG